MYTKQSLDFDEVKLYFRNGCPKKGQHFMYIQTLTSVYTNVNEEQAVMRLKICALFALKPPKITLPFFSPKHTLIFDRFT